MGIKNDLVNELRRAIFEELADRGLSDVAFSHPHDIETLLQIVEKMQIPVRVMVARQKPHAQEDIDMETGQRPSPQWDQKPVTRQDLDEMGMDDLTDEESESFWESIEERNAEPRDAYGPEYGPEWGG